MLLVGDYGNAFRQPRSIVQDVGRTPSNAAPDLPGSVHSEVQCETRSTGDQTDKEGSLIA